jgi:hypothetical protein
MIVLVIVRICHARGLCQGDPLSSMLFLIIMEVLHVLIYRSDDWGLFQRVESCGLLHHALLYTDDLVMFICPMTMDLLHSQSIFSAFEGTSGFDCTWLSVNWV